MQWYNFVYCLHLTSNRTIFWMSGFVTTCACVCARACMSVCVCILVYACISACEHLSIIHNRVHVLVSISQTT